MAKKPYSMVDSLAESLSKKTGTTFKVLRGRLKPGHVTMYGLQATRDGTSYMFQAHRPMELDELKRWLASINDMIAMGFIRVQP